MREHRELGLASCAKAVAGSADTHNRDFIFALIGEGNHLRGSLPEFHIPEVQICSARRKRGDALLRTSAGAKDGEENPNKESRFCEELLLLNEGLYIAPDLESAWTAVQFGNRGRYSSGPGRDW